MTVRALPACLRASADAAVAELDDVQLSDQLTAYRLAFPDVG
jgi:hypothetical protein